MNEKKEKWYKITIIILAVICVIYIGITIYYGRSGSVEYANKLRRINADLRTENNKLHTNLETVSDDLRTANIYTGELRDRIGRAIPIVHRSDERFTVFENTIDDSADIIERMERRQYRINALVAGMRTDNRDLREALGISNTGR
jgi:hypothetical protein